MILKGKNACKETILAKRPVEKVIFRKGYTDDIVSYVKENKIPYSFMDEHKFDNLYKHAQGIVIYTEDYKYYSLNDLLLSNPKPTLVAILDSITDPENLGNIMRTVETLGADFIIIPKSKSVSVNETACKVSCGAFNYVKVVEVSNLSNAIKILKENGFWVAGADMDGEIDYSKMDVSVPLAVVIGSEGYGISRLVKENCDYLIRIPMKGKINSMNASISLAIILANIISRR